jgi:hypothetical protein
MHIGPSELISGLIIVGLLVWGRKNRRYQWWLYSEPAVSVW